MSALLLSSPVLPFSFRGGGAGFILLTCRRAQCFQGGIMVASTIPQTHGGPGEVSKNIQPFARDLRRFKADMGFTNSQMASALVVPVKTLEAWVRDEACPRSVREHAVRGRMTEVINERRQEEAKAREPEPDTDEPKTETLTVRLLHPEDTHWEVAR